VQERPSEARQDFPPPELVRTQLAKILSSPAFDRADLLSSFLTLAVEETLAGRGAALTGSLVVHEIFEKRRPKRAAQREEGGNQFNVAGSARQLRLKLLEYYKDYGSSDPVRIEIPTGGYRAKFRSLGAPDSDRIHELEQRTLELEQQALDQSEAASRNATAMRARVWRWRASSMALGFVLAVGAVVLLLRLAGAKRAPGGPVLTRITTEPGLATAPALSRGGQLLAYASDRGGVLSIWLEDLGSREKRPLTAGPSVDSSPDISPDERTVVYRSERDGGGLYVIPVAGGPEKLLVPSGRGPKYSPDGKWIVYWEGDPSHRGSEMFVIPADSGPPRRLAPDFYEARYPVWSTDGRHILFLGVRDPHDATHDWWTTELGTNTVVQTKAWEAFDQRGLAVAGPAVWVGDRVIFSARTSSVGLWSIRLAAREGHASGSPEPLSLGISGITEASLNGSGRIAFATLTSNTNVWALPADPDEGRKTGEPFQLSRLGGDVCPSISWDGKKLAFSSEQAGVRRLWLQDLDSGLLTMLARSNCPDDSPKISPDGSLVGFTRWEGEVWNLYTISTRTGTLTRVCDDCGPARQFSRDGSLLLYESKSCIPYCIGVVDLRNRATVNLAKDEQDAIFAGGLSHDGRWLAFHTRRGDLDPARKLFLAPFRRTPPISRGEWIPVTHGSSNDREPDWSSGGHILYYLSDRDGFRCIWGQRIDPGLGQPTGDPFAIEHFHKETHSLKRVGSAGDVGLSVTRDKIVFSLNESSGSIWLAQLH
jgi:Tol biopolymer transport system component